MKLLWRHIPKKLLMQTQFAHAYKRGSANEVISKNIFFYSTKQCHKAK